VVLKYICAHILCFFGIPGNDTVARLQHITECNIHDAFINF
jgi:hypothetical protein